MLLRLGGDFADARGGEDLLAARRDVVNGVT